MAGRDSVDPVTLCFAGHLELRPVLQACLEAARALGLAGDDRARLAVLIEELLVNLFEHAGLGADGHLELELAQEEEGIRLELTDNGPPFDPRTASLAQPIPDRGGGVGLAIVRKWAAITDYSPGPPLNRLSLFLRSAALG
jgi:anti-sigma regulatory factor (Ser/Thr protein kinase)